MVLHEPKRVRAVQMLAAGDEPDLVVGERLHRFSWLAAGRGSDPLLLGRLRGSRRRDETGGQHHKRATLECMHSSAHASRSRARRVPTVAAHWVVFRKRRGGADRSTVGPARRRGRRWVRSRRMPCPARGGADGWLGWPELANTSPGRTAQKPTPVGVSTAVRTGCCLLYTSPSP